MKRRTRRRKVRNGRSRRRSHLFTFRRLRSSSQVSANILELWSGTFDWKPWFYRHHWFTGVKAKMFSLTLSQCHPTTVSLTHPTTLSVSTSHHAHSLTLSLFHPPMAPLAHPPTILTESHSHPLFVSPSHPLIIPPSYSLDITSSDRATVLHWSVLSSRVIPHRRWFAVCHNWSTATGAAPAGQLWGQINSTADRSRQKPLWRQNLL